MSKVIEQFLQMFRIELEDIIDELIINIAGVLGVSIGIFISIHFWNFARTYVEIW